MNWITKIAIKEAFRANSKDAIAVMNDLVLCPHPLSVGLYTDDCELPYLVEIDDRKVELNCYRYGDRGAIIGQCPKCHKVYYKE